MARLRGTFSCFQMFFLSEAPGIDQHGNNEQYHTLKSPVSPMFPQQPWVTSTKPINFVTLFH